MTVMRASIAVRHPDTFEAVVLLAGSDVPEWAVDLVHPDDTIPCPGEDAEPESDPGNAAAAAKTRRRPQRT